MAGSHARPTTLCNNAEYDGIGGNSENNTIRLPSLDTARPSWALLTHTSAVATPGRKRLGAAPGLLSHPEPPEASDYRKY